MKIKKTIPLIIKTYVKKIIKIISKEKEVAMDVIVKERKKKLRRRQIKKSKLRIWFYIYILISRKISQQ
jgi:hypothetical protein